MKSIALLAIVGALSVAGAALAGADGPSTTGGSHLVAHNVFGLQTLELQDFGFNAKVKKEGGAEGWFTYRDVEDGVPFSTNGPVTCLTVIGNDAWIGGVIRSSNDPTVVGLGAWWHVTDNGEGTNAPADMTTFLGIGSLAQTQAFCDDHPRVSLPVRDRRREHPGSRVEPGRAAQRRSGGPWKTASTLLPSGSRT